MEATATENRRLISTILFSKTIAKEKMNRGREKQDTQTQTHTRDAVMHAHNRPVYDTRNDDETKIE